MSNSFSNTSDSASNAVLKNYYQGPLIDQLNKDLPIYRAAEKVNKSGGGLKVVRAMRTGRNQGVGAIADSGTLPKIGRQSSVQAEISAKLNYLRFGITALMMKSSQGGDKAAFVEDFGYQLEKGYLDLKKEINRQLCWDGTGDLALVNTASVASTTLVIKGRSTGEPALKYIDVGSTFDVYNSTTLVQSGVTVNAITSGTASSTTATLTLDIPVTTSAEFILMRSGSNSNEIQGLFYALDGGTGTIYNVSRTANIAFQGNVTDVSSDASRLLSIDMMQNPYNEGLRRGIYQSYNSVYCDFTSLRYYQKLLTADKRYSNTVEGDGTFGKKGKFFLDFNGISVVPDQDMPVKFAFLPAEALVMYEWSKMEAADESGSMYIPQSDSDSFEVRIRHFVNLFNESPASCAVLTGYLSP